MGTRKNRLIEMVLLKKTNVDTDGLKNIQNFILEKFVYLELDHERACLQVLPPSKT